jgi:hypothetical protein
MTGAPLVWPPLDEEAMRFVARHLFVPTSDKTEAVTLTVTVRLAMFEAPIDINHATEMLVFPN